MLHIYNGDSTANTMRGSGFPGEHFAFREALATGPTPQGLSQDEWLSTRASFLAQGGGLDAGDVREDLFKQDEALKDMSGHDEIILWFSHDLLCQVTLIYLLDRLSRGDLGGERLSLICIGEFPGVKSFTCLGQLTAQQLASLFDTRREVTDAQMRLAQKAWQAYCSPVPSTIEEMIDDDTSSLPLLRGAMLRHLARFPSVKNGLGHAENKLLKFVGDGTDKFIPLCAAFFHAEPAYGLGDYQVRHDVKRMAEAEYPLLDINGLDESGSGNDYSRASASFNITENGKSVLESRDDFIEMNSIDLWLGGTHLREKEDLWRWDEEKQRLTSNAA